MPSPLFAEELAQYGPQRPAVQAPTPAEARQYCRRLAQSHYENFTVASWLLPRHLRPHFYSVYAYCRWADDLADESPSPAEATALLAWWDEQLTDCYEGRCRHPVFVALRESIIEFDIPPAPFRDLLSAFRQDQQVTRYETFAELLDYCRRSANPVGRLVLYLGRSFDEQRATLSDLICTGLQLANFWQDVAADWHRGRLYIPRESLARHNADESHLQLARATPELQAVLADEVARTEDHLHRGLPLAAPKNPKSKIQNPKSLPLPPASASTSPSSPTAAWPSSTESAARTTTSGPTVPNSANGSKPNSWPIAPSATASGGGPDASQLPSAPQHRAALRTPSRAASNPSRAAIPCSPAPLLIRSAPAPRLQRGRPLMTAPLDESYALCRRIARKAAKNFFYSFLLLPRDKRRAMYALYAFLRRTDDLADSDEPPEVRRTALAAWRTALDEALAGRMSDPILPALVDSVARFSIPREYLTAAIDGCEMDLHPVAYRTFDQLAVYCHHVASVVGLACIHVWGFDGPEALEPARRCGIAFQLTNILRDLGKDARAGRVYLPQEDLDRFGYTHDELAAGVCNDRFRTLVRFQVNRAEQFYRDAAPLAGWLRPEGRSALAAMYGIYHALLDEVRRRPDTVLERRISLPAWRKLWLMASALPARFRPGARVAMREAGVSIPRIDDQRWVAWLRWYSTVAMSVLCGGFEMSLNQSTDRRPRVVIVGGGLAGLAAAIALAPRGFAVTLLESRRQLGGRATSFRDAVSGELVDHCQHVSLGCCTNWAQFCRTTGLDELVRRDSTLHFFAPDGRRYDLRGVGWLPAPLHLAPGLLGLGYLSMRERLGIAVAMLRLARVRPRYDDPTAPTIGAWLRAIGQSPRAIERFWTPVLVSALSESLDRASLAHARKVFVDGFMASRHAYEIEVPRVPLAEIYGGRLTTWLAEHNVEVLLGAPVKRITVERIIGDAQRVTAVQLTDGRMLPAEHVVCAVPWRRCRELFTAETAAALPWLEGLAKIESAPITGLHLWFDREITALPHAVLVERLSQWLFNRGPAPLDSQASGGRKPPEETRSQHTSEGLRPPLAESTSAHYYQVVISASRDLAARPREEVVAEVQRDLAATFPAAAAARLIRWRMVTEQVAVFSVLPGMDRLRPNQQTPIQGLTIAGDWTATGWPSTMEGAIRSGHLAAEAITRTAGRADRILAPELPRSLSARIAMFNR